MKQLNGVTPIIIGLSLILGGCMLGDGPSGEAVQNAKDNLFSKVLNDDNVNSQRFLIPSDKDTFVTTDLGTIVRLYANTFSLNDNVLSGDYELEIKEVFEPVDFVLANLTTTTNGVPLTSGGMIFLNATQSGEQLTMANEKEIGLMVPTDNLDESMQIFQGAREDGLMDWSRPEPVLNQELRSWEQMFKTITYSYYEGESEMSSSDSADFSRWIWEPQRVIGDKVSIAGTAFGIVAMTTDTTFLKENANGVFSQKVITQKGRNGYVEDFNANYIFSVKKLGWANIDKLFDDPRSEEVDLIAQVTNQSEFDYVFTSLIIPGQNMYLPGYQKRDNTYSYSHDDNEKMVLPIGEEVTLLATAYQNDKPFFQMSTFIVAQEQEVVLALEETTIDELKAQLESEL